MKPTTSVILIFASLLALEFTALLWPRSTPPHAPADSIIFHELTSPLPETLLWSSPEKDGPFKGQYKVMHTKLEPIVAKTADGWEITFDGRGYDDSARRTLHAEGSVSLSGPITRVWVMDEPYIAKERYGSAWEIRFRAPGDVEKTALAPNQHVAADGYNIITENPDGSESSTLLYVPIQNRDQIFDDLLPKIQAKAP